MSTDVNAANDMTFLKPWDANWQAFVYYAVGASSLATLILLLVSLSRGVDIYKLAPSMPIANVLISLALLLTFAGGAGLIATSVRQYTQAGPGIINPCQLNHDLFSVWGGKVDCTNIDDSISGGCRTKCPDIVVAQRVTNFVVGVLLVLTLLFYFVRCLTGDKNKKVTANVLVKGGAFDPLSVLSSEISGGSSSYLDLSIMSGSFDA
jgi:hypothetical protein